MQGLLRQGCIKLSHSRADTKHANTAHAHPAKGEGGGGLSIPVRAHTAASAASCRDDLQEPFVSLAGRDTLKTVPIPGTRALDTPADVFRGLTSARLSRRRDSSTAGSPQWTLSGGPHGARMLCCVSSLPIPSPCEPDSSEPSDRLRCCPGMLESGDGEKAAEMPVFVRRMGMLLNERHSGVVARFGRKASGRSTSPSGSKGGSEHELMTCTRFELGLWSLELAAAVTHRPSEMSAAEVTAITLALRRPCGICGASECRCASAEASYTGGTG